MPGDRKIGDSIVFVLGAGASAPYGFPTGDKLIREICETLRDRAGKEDPVLLERRCAASDATDSGDTDSLQELDHALKTLNAFQGSIIDDYFETLSHADANNGFRMMTLRAMATFFLIKEEESKIRFLHSGRVDDDDLWYNRFYDLLLRLRREKPEARVTVLTYNYERSLEYFLAQAKPRFSVEFIYLHGALGSLDVRSERNTPYGVTPSRKNIGQAARGVVPIYSTGVDQPGYEPLKRAHAALDGATHLFVLGFAWDRKNVTRLFREGTLSSYTSKVIRGTRHGLPQRRQAVLMEYFHDECRAGFFYDEKCIPFFDNHLPL